MAPRTPGTKRTSSKTARGGNKQSARGGGGTLQSLTLPQLRQWHKSHMQTEKLIDGLQTQQQIQKPILQAMGKIHGQTFDFTQTTNTNARSGGTNARGGKTKAVTGRGRAQNNQQSATG